MSTKELLTRITIDPNICHGKPCIRGMRYPVEFILEMLSGETTEAELLEDFPSLERDDIKAAHAFAYEVMRDRRVKQQTHLPA